MPKDSERSDALFDYVCGQDYFTATRELEDIEVTDVGWRPHLNAKSACCYQAAQAERGGRPDPAVKVIHAAENKKKSGNQPPQRRPPQVGPKKNTSGKSQGRPKQRLASEY